jgi:trimethylamine--corrinoid protein Co-methyltransferase
MYKPLSRRDIETIHRNSLEILEKSGVLVYNDRAIEILSTHGAIVDSEKRIVKFPHIMIEENIRKAPSSFTLYGREEKNHIYHRKGKVYTSTGGSALYILDLERGQRRLATLSDLRDIIKLVDALDHIDLVSLPIYPNDLPKEKVDINRFYIGLSYSTKHIAGAIYTLIGLEKVCRLMEIISDQEDWQKRPLISIVLCPIISPLRLDNDPTDLLIKCTQKGIVTYNMSMVQVGSSAPMTLAGTLTIMNAEFLAVATLIQLIKPGLPTFYVCVPGLTEMRKGTWVSGGVEYALLNGGATQMAHFYGVPVWATAGRTDSKVVDIQAGYEHAMTIPYTFLAKANHITCGAGFLESVMTVSLELYVIDNEIIGMAKRVQRGIEFNSETLALDIILEKGPGGNFLGEPHTVKYMRSELFNPIVSDRSDRIEWEQRGSKDGWARAREVVKKILSTHKPKRFDPKIETKIREEFPEIVDV